MINISALFSALKSGTRVYNTALILLCLFMPVIAPAIGQEFYTDVFARTMIWAIAAVSLNFIMGYGGMISFGHAVFLGLGGYTVGILAFHGIESAYIQWPLALLVSGLFALVIGAICLRTKGVYFIMITLAFAQMVYFLSLSLEVYGSDDGLNIDTRSDFGLSFFDLNDAMTMYYLIFAVMIGCLYLTHRLVNSRFGMVIRGSQSNDDRMHSIGYPTYRYKLAAFVIAGVMCGLAGVLSANFEDFISPDTMFWPRSGDLIFMVVLGGMGTIFGPLGGAIIFGILAEILSNITDQWHLIFGPFLILVVLFARGGLEGLIGKWGLGRDRTDP
ncbi:MAG: branched-chain amino acid ABC transporter permease [Rhodospirillaceae bacterium]|jgi:branched-chain amino acid transport system permease protein|nr:branched-chain amino acid ABC transporter permease [Rhodospirillaceae bacterium]MBT3884358.1 branched-chain amino acid ABC transporter permease [Rhodospirillaceae bacterium]MBT4117096.1 branched-chain amino acid ABC transporter permease [Rhodospirillaceae bacterium]MBT4672875.1 branched-chain amino acid ABC transporter permease [Rhodospirillaceae bacterium]MBT4721032.1 branched-chain amino acid ABC transporter permease [Rhodospirillaceae bacterium]